MTAASQITQLIDNLTLENKVAPILDATSQSFIRENIFIFSDNSRNNINSSGWESFLCLEDKDTNSLLTKIGTGGKTYKNLVNMTTLEKSFLVPKIQLYKVMINGKTRKQTGEVPITFPDSAKENIESIIKSKGQRGDDIAIKSFTFDFKNQDPFGAGRIVDCSLVLTLLSGESLVKKRPNGFAFSDLIVRNNRLDQKRFDSDYYEIKANVGYSIPNKGISSALRGQLENNNISMLLYLVDYDMTFQQNGVIELSLQYRARIEAVTENIIKYNIFRESVIKTDASIKLKLADIERDIVALDKESGVIQEKIQGVKTKAGNKKQVAFGAGSMSPGAYAPAGRPSTMGGGTSQATSGFELVLTEKAKKELVQLDSQLDKVVLQRNKKNNAYNEMSSEILYLQAKNKVELYGELMHNMFHKGKVYRTELDVENLLVFGPAFSAALNKMATTLMTGSPLGALSVPALYTEAEKRRADAEKYLLKQVKEGSVATITTFDLSREFDILAKEIADGMGKSIGDAQVVAAAIEKFNPEKYIGLGRNDSLKGISDAELGYRGKKIIYWFYLGDLFDQAIKMNKLHYRLRDDHIIPCLGSFNLSDPKNIDSTIKTLNIADIPVTIEEFVSFFKANIIEPNVHEYPLYYFIRDVIQRLAMPAMNIMSFSNAQQESKILKVTTFDLPAKKDGKTSQEPISDGTYAQDYQEAEENGARGISFGSAFQRKQKKSPTKKFASYSGRVEMSDLIDNQKLGNNSSLLRKPPSHRYSYFLFYGTSRGTNLRWSGDIEKDSKRGVQHFYIGSDRGLIKEVNFLKSQRPGLAEMMAENSLRAGDRKVELWRNFEADISMVGNSLLKPGCFLYINPTVSGLGNPSSHNSLSSIMGLGGYYIVLSVSNVINETGWNTQVRAVWQSRPSG